MRRILVLIPAMALAFSGCGAFNAPEDPGAPIQLNKDPNAPKGYGPPTQGGLGKPTKGAVPK